MKWIFINIVLHSTCAAKSMHIKVVRRLRQIAISLTSLGRGFPPPGSIPDHTFPDLPTKKYLYVKLSANRIPPATQDTTRPGTICTLYIGCHKCCHLLKGTLAWDFGLLFFFIKSKPLVPWFLPLYTIEYKFEFAEIFKFKGHSAYYQNMGNEIFLSC